MNSWPKGLGTRSDTLKHVTDSHSEGLVPNDVIVPLRIANWTLLDNNMLHQNLYTKWSSLSDIWIYMAVGVLQNWSKVFRTAEFN